MEFVWIPKGCFQMGSPASESGRGGDEHQHQVCVEGYWLGKYEVTNTQYRQFKPSHDSGNYKGNSLNGDTQPVVNVSWNDAVAYAEWLSSKTGKTFKLPTEAEWEYAARAGTKTARYWGDDDANALPPRQHRRPHGKVASFKVSTFAYDGCDDGYKVSAPVGRFAPNAYGLHDMLGNVWEWTASPYDQSLRRRREARRRQRRGRPARVPVRGCVVPRTEGARSATRPGRAWRRWATATAAVLRLARSP